MTRRHAAAKRRGVGRQPEFAHRNFGEHVDVDVDDAAVGRGDSAQHLDAEVLRRTSGFVPIVRPGSCIGDDDHHRTTVLAQVQLETAIDSQVSLRQQRAVCAIGSGDQAVAVDHRTGDEAALENGQDDRCTAPARTATAGRKRQSATSDAEQLRRTHPGWCDSREVGNRSLSQRTQRGGHTGIAAGHGHQAGLFAVGVDQLAAILCGGTSCDVGADGVSTGILAGNGDAAGVTGAFLIEVLNLELGAIGKLELQVLARLGGNHVGRVFCATVQQVLHPQVLPLGDFDDLFLARLQRLGGGLRIGKLLGHEEAPLRTGKLALHECATESARERLGQVVQDAALARDDVGRGGHARLEVLWTNALGRKRFAGAPVQRKLRTEPLGQPQEAAP